MNRNNKISELEIKELIGEKGLSLTQARLKLLTVLVGEHGPFSLEELHKKVKDNGFDFTTVYRCLTTFENHGLVRRCDFGDGVSRFEYEDKKGHHHHLVCRSCKLVTPLDSCAIPGITQMEENLKRKGFKDIKHSLEFFGLCKSCG